MSRNSKLATGAALDAALGRYRGKRTGEPALLRQMAEAFEPGDVVPGDRGFGSFYELALWRARGVDAVVRLHQARRADFRAGRRLGRRGHVVVWDRPDRPEWLDDATYASLPREPAVREVEGASGGGVGKGVSRPNGTRRGRVGRGRWRSPTGGPKTLPGPVEPTGGARGSQHQKRNGHRRRTPRVG